MNTPPVLTIRLPDERLTVEKPFMTNEETFNVATALLRTAWLPDSPESMTVPLPNALALEATRVPPSTIVPPRNVLAPLTSKRPTPRLSREPEPLIWPIMARSELEAICTMVLDARLSFVASAWLPAKTPIEAVLLPGARVSVPLPASA